MQASTSLHKKKNFLKGTCNKSRMLPFSDLLSPKEDIGIMTPLCIATPDYFERYLDMSSIFVMTLRVLKVVPNTVSAP